MNVRIGTSKTKLRTKRMMMIPICCLLLICCASYAGCTGLQNHKKPVTSRIESAQFVPDLNKLMSTAAAATALGAGSDTEGIKNRRVSDEITEDADSSQDESNTTSKNEVIKSSEYRIENLKKVAATDKEVSADFVQNYDTQDTWYVLKPEDYKKYEQHTIFTIGAGYGKYYVTEAGEINVYFYLLGTHPKDSQKKHIVISADNDTVEVFSEYNNASLWFQGDKEQDAYMYLPYVKNIRDTELFVVEESVQITYKPKKPLSIPSDYEAVRRSVFITSYVKSENGFNGTDATYNFDNYLNIYDIPAEDRANRPGFYYHNTYPVNSFGDLRFSEAAIRFTDGSPFVYKQTGMRVSRSGYLEYHSDIYEGEGLNRFVSTLVANTVETPSKILKAFFSPGYVEGSEDFDSRMRDVEFINFYYEFLPEEYSYKSLTEAFTENLPYRLQYGNGIHIPFPNDATIRLPENFDELWRMDEIVAQKSLLGVDNLANNYESLFNTVFENYLKDRFAGFFV